MNDNERLERIKEQCEERGWTWFEPEPWAGTVPGKHYNICNSRLRNRFDLLWGTEDKQVGTEYDVGLQMAELLLAATSPDAPVVEIELDCYDCALDPIHCGMSQGVSPEGGEGSDIPGPNCPGPAPDGKEWVIILRDKVVE